MKRVVMALALGLLTAGPAWAAFDDGVTAYLNRDFQTAVREFRPLADRGDADAQTFLASMYARGEGVPQDHAEAVKWLKLAADQGLVGAQFKLAVLYENGWGVARDYAEAASWHRRAAERGFVLGQLNLGAAYTTGRGVPQDYIQAHMWFNLAAAQGHEVAAESRDIARRMTLTELGEAQRLAREWEPKPR